MSQTEQSTSEQFRTGQPSPEQHAARLPLEQPSPPEPPQSVTLAVIGDGRREKRYEELTFMDDFMFGKIMSDRQNCKRLLEIVLHIDPATEIAEPETQGSIRAAHGAKSVIVDVRTQDAYNDYDLEAQKRPHPNLPKRARYYQAMMDIDFLEAGKDYAELKNNYIIFICLSDLFRKGLPVYTFQNRCTEDTSLLLGDCTTKIFLNASKYDKIADKELKAIMEYVQTGEATSSYTTTIDRLVTEAKANPFWKREYMDAKIEKARQENAERKAREEGAQEKARETAQKFLQMGLSVEQVAQGTGLTEDEVLALDGQD